MNCPRKSLFLAVASALVLWAPHGFAQNPPSKPPPAPTNPPAPAQGEKQAQQPQAPPPISVTVRRVVVPVTVKDKKGNLFFDLKRDEFRIFEENVEQRITSFSVEVFPLSMIVLVDNDLKQKDASQVEPSLISIVGGMSTSDEAFVCRFDQFFYPGKGFTNNQDKLVTQLQRTQIAGATTPSVPPPGGPFGGPTINNAPAPGAPQDNYPSTLAIKGQPTKAIDDAVYAAAMLLKERSGEKRRKIVLLISDGQNGAKFNNHKYDEVRAELLRQGIMVYSVAVGSAYFDRRFNRLVEYAHDTGGDIYFGAKSETFDDFYSQITEEARNQYTLTFEPKGDDSLGFHPIEVRVLRGGLTILTRKGYYGGASADEASR
jgi:VWFA-related protein